MVEVLRSAEVQQEDASPAGISLRAKRLMAFLNVGQGSTRVDRQGIPGTALPQEGSHLTSTRELKVRHDDLASKLIESFIKGGERGSVVEQQTAELAELHARIDTIRGRQQIDPAVNGSTYGVRPAEGRKLAQELEPHIAHVDRVVTLLQYEELLQEDVLQAAVRFGDEYETLTKELGGDPLKALADSKVVLEQKLATEKTPNVISQLHDRIATIDRILVRIPHAQDKLHAMLIAIEEPIKQHSSTVFLRLFSGMQKEDTIATYLRDFISKNPPLSRSSLQQISRLPQFKDDPGFKEILTIVPPAVTDLSIESLVFGVKSPREGVPDISPYFLDLEAQLHGIFFEGKSEDVRTALPQWIDGIKTNLQNCAPAIVAEIRQRITELSAAVSDDSLSPLKKSELQTELKRCQDFLKAAEPIVNGDPTVEQISLYADHLSWQIRENLKATITHENSDGSKKEIVVAHELNADLIRLKTEALVPRMMESPDGFIKNWELFRDSANDELERVQGRMNFTTKALSLLVTQRHFGPATRPFTGDGQRGKFEGYRPLSAELEASLSREWQTYAGRTSDLAGEVEGLANGNPGMLDFMNMFREDGSGFGDEMKAQLGNLLTSFDSWATYITWYLPSTVGLDKLFGVSGAGEQVRIKEIQLELQKMQERVKTVRNVYEVFLAEHKQVLDAMRKDMVHLQILQAAVPSEKLLISRGEPIYPPESASTDMDGYITIILEEYRGAEKKVAEVELKGTEQDKRNAEQLLNEAKRKLIGANLFVLGTFREIHVPEFITAMKDLQTDLHDSVGLAVSTTHQLDNLNGAWWKYALGFELSTAPVWWLAGGRGGLRGYPGVRFLMQNNQRGVFYMLRGLSNAPARIVNGHLRLIDGVTTGGLIGRIGDSLQSRSELRALRATLQEAQQTVVQQADELASSTRRIADLEAEISRLKSAVTQSGAELATKEAELARLNARVLTLEEQLAKATTVPGAVARRTQTLARVAEFTATETGGRLMGDIATNQRAISSTEATIREIVSLTDEAARTARAAELASLQVRLGELLRADRSLRIDAAKNLLGSSANVTDEAAELIWRAHITDSLSGKVKLLRQAMGMVYENVDDAAKAANFLARSGIAGDVATAIANAEKVTSRVSAQVLARITEMGLPEASETIIKIASSPRGMQFLDEAFKIGGEEGAARASKYLAALGEGAQEALSDPALVKAVVTSGDDAAKLGMVMTKLGTARTFQAAECLTMMDDLAKLRRLGPRALSGLETTALVAGPLIEAAMVGYDIYELVQAKERQTEKINSMVGALDQMVAQGLMTKDGNTYKGPGCAIDVTQIKDLSATEVEAQWARTAVDTAALVGTTATSIVVLSGAAGPPGLAAGLIVAGVIITVHVGISTIEGSIDQYRRSQFLKAAPPWLMAMLGPEGLVGQKTEDVIREHTGTMRSEYMPRSWGEAALTFNPVTGPIYQGSRLTNGIMNAEQTEQEKQAVKEKSMQALAFRTFASEHPDLVPELPGGGNVQSLLLDNSDFLKAGGDYEKIIRPLITLQLQASAQPALLGVSGLFGYTSDPDVRAIDRLVLPDASQLDGSAVDVRDDSRLLEQAGRRAMLFYVHHVREERYRKAITAIETDTRYDGDYKAYLISQYDDFIDQNKSHHFVFNVHPKTLSRGGPTLAEKIVAQHALTPERASSDMITAVEAASMGYSLPDGEQDMSLKKFLRLYVEPAQSKETEESLETYSAANADLPFNFQQMEQWKTEQEFEAGIKPSLAKLKRINELFAVPGKFRTDAALKRAYESVSPADITLYEKFSQHQNFYNEYFSSWRHSDLYVSPYSRQWVTMLTDWNNKGNPTLIDEQRFTQYQQALARPQNDPFRFENDLGWLRDAERTLPGFTYDPKHPERIISTYDQYMKMLRLGAPIVREEFNPFIQLEEPSIMNLLKPRQEDQQRIEKRENALDELSRTIERMRNEKNLRIADGTPGGSELSSFDNLSNSLAVEEKDLPTFMQSWARADGFDELRADILSKRLFVISAPVSERRLEIRDFNRRR